jgi:hypothetical protein
MDERYPVIRLRSDYGILEARDGIILCFFMRRSHRDVAPAIWRALQTYLRAIPPRALAWYGDPDGDPHPLDEAGWQHVRGSMLEPSDLGSCHVDLWAFDSDVGGYNFEYSGRQLDHPIFTRDAGATCGISFSFPTEYLQEHGPAHLRALALELARELPFSFGYASLAVVSPGGRWTSARQALLPALTRYLGLDLYHLSSTSRVIGTGARGAYWLTFLGPPLLGQLGGLEPLRQQLPFPDVSFEALEGERALLTVGEWPSALDDRQAPDVSALHTLACLLEPFFPEEEFPLVHMLDQENMARWLRRLCQPLVKLPWDTEDNG